MVSPASDTYQNEFYFGQLSHSDSHLKSSKDMASEIPRSVLAEEHSTSGDAEKSLELQLRLYNKPLQSQVFQSQNNAFSIIDLRASSEQKTLVKSLDRLNATSQFIPNLQRKIYAERGCLPHVPQSAGYSVEVVPKKIRFQEFKTSKHLTLPTLTVQKTGSENQSEVRINTHEKAVGSSVLRKSRSTGVKNKSDVARRRSYFQPDPKLLLTCLQTNLYDVTEPKNDNFVEVIIEKRKKLGWVVDLPELAPGFRKRLSRLLDHVDPSLERQLSKGLDVDQSDGEYFYALYRNRRDQRARYNPYDLQIVSANDARPQFVYYLGTSTSVIRVEKTSSGEICERMRFLDWLWERKLFSLIFHLKVFQQFRIWKTFKLWQRNLRMKKNNRCQIHLYKILLASNEYLGGCLLHIQSLCEAASSSLDGHGIGESAVELVKLDRTVTMTLSQFVESQQQQCKMAEERLRILRSKVIELVFETCATVAEHEGITDGIRDLRGESLTGGLCYDACKNLSPKKAAPESGNGVGFWHSRHQGDIVSPSQPETEFTYAQAVAWHRVLRRLSDFIRLVDCHLAEMLRRIVRQALWELTRFAAASSEAGRQTKDAGHHPGHCSDVEFGILERTLQPVSASFTDKEIKASSTKQNGSVFGRLRRGSREFSFSSVTHPGFDDVVHFDVNKKEAPEALLDVDKILQEIKEQHEVVVTAEAIISIELELVLPAACSDDLKESSPPSAAKASPASKVTSCISSVSSASKVCFPRKSVQFDQSLEVEMPNDGEVEEDDEDAGPFDDKDDRTSSSDDRSQKSPLSEVTIALSPGVTAIKDSFLDIEVNFRKTIATVSSLLTEPRLAVFYAPPRWDQTCQRKKDEDFEEDDEDATKNTWPNVQLLFEQDDSYVRMRKQLTELVDQALDEVTSYSWDYRKYVSMVERARLVELEYAWKKKQWTTEQFQGMLVTFTEQSQMMNEMVQVNRFGFIQFSAKRFLEQCLPYPVNILSTVQSHLPKVAVEKNEKLINTIKAAWKKLDKVPESVEEFVERMSFLGKVTGDLPALEKDYNFVTKLFTLANDFAMVIEPEDFAVYQILSPSFQQLKSTITYAEAKLDDNIVKFSVELERLILEMGKRVASIKNQVMDPLFLSLDTMAIVALQRIEVIAEEVSQMLTKARNFSSYRERFESSLTKTRKLLSEEIVKRDQKKTVPAYDLLLDLGEIERDLMLRRLLWESQQEWDALSTEWIETPFDLLNVDQLQKHVNRLTQTIYVLEKGLPNNEVVPQLKDKVMAFKQLMPCILSLRNPSLKPRHWNQIESLLEKSIVDNDKLTLGNLRDMKVIRHKTWLQEISTIASSEATLEQMLEKVSELWQTNDLRLVPHSSGSVCIISGADELFTQLEESQVTIGMIRGSRYVAPIKAAVEDWERKLQLFAKTLEVWLLCQRNWLYLEQIFSFSDIQRQMPSEASLFDDVDKSWKDIMRQTAEHPNAIRAATAIGVLETLSTVNSQLEKIQKCLNDYLETKRLVFPRFYFLSNEDLLDVLVQSKTPDAIQSYLVKCFASIHSLDIQSLPRQPPTVKTMTSPEGEVIAMPRSLRARGPVEQWLGNVETAMFDTVKKNLHTGLADWNELKVKEWIMKQPGQVMLVVTQVLFSRDVDDCLSNSNSVTSKLKALQTKIVRTLDLYAEVMSTKLVLCKRLGLCALLTVSVHCRDVVSDLIGNKVVRQDDFEWTRQLRYEWDEKSKKCSVLQFMAKFTYGYEYLGCSGRLVITPLTDRCYLTLTGAVHLHLGGAPAGPAGTGKTETVKDLARRMGKLCVVFNCSDGLDFKTLGRFFSGLSQSGSWYCFDEFNRIDVEVLSVVAQQLHTIKMAKDQNLPRFIFEGRDIQLNPSCAVFITMNPSYSGRVELPDNLKFFFRPVSMVVPDYILIAEVLLFSEGFSAAKLLSAKVVSLYQLASKQLSQQDHYDFGMRAIKSVLLMAGQRKRQQHRNGHPIVNYEMETELLIQVLLDANIPKFLLEDVPLFRSLMSDLFPGIKLLSSSSRVLDQAISLSVQDQGLVSWPSQVDKVKQFYYQLLVRHGVMLVGPATGGKTAIRNVMQRALALLPTINVEEEAEENANCDPEKKAISFNTCKRGQLETVTINPKCIMLGELYGQMDSDTLEWSDGLLANAVRRFARAGATPLSTSAAAMETKKNRTTDEMADPKQTNTDVVRPDVVDAHQTVFGAGDFDSVPTDWYWIVLDGPVDTLWVESLNTALDDSKILCLPNGERIPLVSNLRLIFEVDDLSVASPATVSRCAMVYVDPADLGWQPYVQTWINRLTNLLPETGRSYLQLMFNHSIGRGLEFFRRFQHLQVIPVPEMSCVSCLCSILAAYFDFMKHNGGFGVVDESQGRSTSAPSNSLKSSRRSTSGNRGQKSSPFADQHSDSQSDHALKDFYVVKNPTLLNVLLGKLFVFAFTWGFGGNLKRQKNPSEEVVSIKGAGGIVQKAVDITDEFDSFVRELFEVEPPCGVRLPPSNRSMFSYFVDLTTGNFVIWDNLVPSTRSLIEQGALMTSMDSTNILTGQWAADFELVPTVDTVRFSFMSSLLLLQKNPVLLTGEAGVGKTVLIKRMLQLLERDGGGRDGSAAKKTSVLGSVLNYSEKSQNLLDHMGLLEFRGQSDEEDQEGAFSGVNGNRLKRHHFGLITSAHQFSAQTSARQALAALMSRLLKKTRDRLGAPKDKQVIVFIDDLNMPAPETYGAQPALEMVRQFLDLGGFYDSKKCTWKNINDVFLISSCGEPGAGRNYISPRLLKHFCVLALPQPSSFSLQHIYQVHLGRFLNEGDFLAEVKDCLQPLISAALSVYRRASLRLKPTPAKLHYMFSFNDISKVISGMFQSSSKVIVTQLSVVQLFIHEAMRIFHDRLVDDADCRTFCRILSDAVYENFKIRWTAERLMSDPVLFADFDSSSSVSSDNRTYKPVTDHAKMAKVLEDIFVQTDLSNSQIVFFQKAVEHVLRAARVLRQMSGHMLLVGFDGTGRSTTAKMAAQIAGCSMHQLNLTKGYSIADFRQDLKKVYIGSGVRGNRTLLLLRDSDIVKDSFLEDLSSVLSTGEVPHLFDNEEMDGIMMDLKSAAATEDVADTRPAMHQFLIRRVKRNLHIILMMSHAGSSFRNYLRQYPSLINRCTIDWYNDWNADAMLSVAHIYFKEKYFFTETSSSPESERIADEMAGVVPQVCLEIHNSVAKVSKDYWNETRRQNYVTPSTYIELMRTYSSMLKTKKEELIVTRNRLLAGLNRLVEANSLVGTMQVELVELGPKIEAKAKDTEALLDQLTEAQKAVEQVREIVRSEEATMKEEKEVVHEYAQECKRDLDSVIPTLELAVESLKSLDKADIVEIRVYTNPPDLVTMVIFGICLLLGQRADDWNRARQVVASPNFLQTLVNLDKNAVPEKVFAKLKKFTSHPDFNPEKVGMVSKACCSMCLWVLAVEHYHDVYKMAKPKQKRLEEAQEALQLAQENLEQKQQSLGKIEGHLRILQQHYQDSVNQRESLKERKELTAVRLKRAAILIQALSMEKDRWAESANQLERSMHYVVGDILLSASFVVYCGVFTSKYRQSLVSSWQTMCHSHSLPASSDYSFVKSVATDSQVLRWQNEGLPHDLHSLENAVIIRWSRKWPLLIDPQGQASLWIQEMEGRNLITAQVTSSNYIRAIENGVRDGKPVLIQDVGETFDPTLNKVLHRETFVSGTSHLIEIGGIESEYNENFRLYVTTSLLNPNCMPLVFNHLTIINFTVTFTALQEQLLSRVVRKEQPELENERCQLLAGITSDLQTLTDLEDKSLALLHTSQGHILDQEDLIAMLQRSKDVSTEIKQRVKHSEQMEKQLNHTRQKYLPVATRGAVIYLVLADLGTINFMYQFSLAWFQEIFDSCLVRKQEMLNHTAESADEEADTRVADAAVEDKRENGGRKKTDVNLNQYLQEMIDRVTLTVFRLVSAGLFADHQLTFTFAMFTSILRANHQRHTGSTPRAESDFQAETGSVSVTSARGEISEADWNAFLQSNFHATMTSDKIQNEDVHLKNISCPSWMTDSVWHQCIYLEMSLSAFKDLCLSLTSCHGQWKALQKSTDPYHLLEHKFSDPVTESVKMFAWDELTCFQRLILIKVLRPSALTSSAYSFIQENFGREFVATQTNQLLETFGKSTAKTPIIFVLSPGSNPMSQLLGLAKEIRGSAIHLDVISLGRGQGQKAEELIGKSQILKGRWIFLQNCHLAGSWMPKLQAIVSNFSKPGVEFDSNFRLWLSSTSDPCFPISVLQAGVKVAVEPPHGIKAKLMRTYASSQGGGGVSESLHDSMEPSKSHSWRCLLFGLSFFNAILHERKKYNQLGWNVAYEFNDSDLEVSILQLQLIVKTLPDLPWSAVWYLIGEVIYGGRVTDDWDRRCLLTLLHKFCNPDALTPDYAYSTDKVYHGISGELSYDEVRQYIKELPSLENPELFGMDPNADEAAQECQGKQLMDALLLIQPRFNQSFETLSSGKKKDELVMTMALEMKTKIPQRVECHEDDGTGGRTSTQVVCLNLNDILSVARESDSPVMKNIRRLADEKKVKGIDISSALRQVEILGQSAMFTVLCQEVRRFEQLLEVIQRSLDSLILGVKGEILMSRSLEEMYDAFIAHVIPPEWKGYSFESCKSLGAWVRDLICKVKFFHLWSVHLVSYAEQLFKPQSSHLLTNKDLNDKSAHPSKYWLSAFFFPQGFLTAVLQNHARKTGLLIDTLGYRFKIGSLNQQNSENGFEPSLQLRCFMTDMPANGVVVWGLHLDGASWDSSRGVLCDSPLGQRFSSLPEVHFIPTQSSEANSKQLIQSEEDQTQMMKYECPLYQTTLRMKSLSSAAGGSNFVTSLLLDTDRNPQLWILRSVALVCDLDE